MSREEDDRPEREKLSWREIDQRRDGKHRREERAPQSAAARARASAATKQYLKQIDTMFGKPPADAEEEQLVRAMREAHGTPALAPACRAYLDAVGVPEDVGLLSLFLDSGDVELMLSALEAMRTAHESGTLEVTAGQKSQLRTLALGADDSVAEAAEELLDLLA